MAVLKCAAMVIILCQCGAIYHFFLKIEYVNYNSKRNKLKNCQKNKYMALKLHNWHFFTLAIRLKCKRGGFYEDDNETCSDCSFPPAPLPYTLDGHIQNPRLLMWEMGVFPPWERKQLYLYSCGWYLILKWQLVNLI